jgi:hypothetical protein
MRSKWNRARKNVAIRWLANTRGDEPVRGTNHDGRVCGLPRGDCGHGSGRIVRSIGEPGALFRDIALSANGPRWQRLKSIVGSGSGISLRDESGGGGASPGKEPTTAWPFVSTARSWPWRSSVWVARLEGHEESTHDLAFSPDGAYLASCSGGLQSTKDRTIRVWDLAAGRELRRFEGHRGAVSVVAFTRDGRSVVSGSEDATA